MPYRQDDINLLLPSFRSRVERVLKGVRAAGYKPCLFDTLRTREEAARNAKKGTGSANSMHLYGCAADVICDEHGWSCDEHKCDFYRVLVDQVVAAGLVSGRYFSKVDMPHMQGVRVGQQGEMRTIGSGPEGAVARDVLVRIFLEETSARYEIQKALRAGATPDAGLVKLFQRSVALKPDGVLGPKTLAKVNAARDRYWREGIFG